jgi:hypothetical protein
LKPGQKVMLMLPGKAKKTKAAAGKKRRQTANKPG